jgi:uncharacterized membrane protein
VDAIRHQIDIDLPVRMVYEQWTKFEDFPQFMSGVEEVRQVEGPSPRPRNG